ncbi:BRCA1-A complex subunit BRE [Trichinella pseudospiralis]|uniref:BRISC and BRCA1-A complex member 2 n=1 Tax=Trichinella pseudospiralis TaxID=6337 RepID=A0A0V1F8R3_TRIPS|nr:BRCA1-A complex subunit BRE [Trichinella pseudospiralis]
MISKEYSADHIIMSRNLESSSDKNTSEETFCYKSYSDSVVRCLVDWLKTPVKQFLDYPIFGYFKANICQIQSGASSFVLQQLKNVPLGDRFRIFINFGDFEFSCYVVFQWSHQMVPPEFYFKEENFIPEVEMIEAYTRWNISNSNCLLDLFLELFMKYQDFHLYNCYLHSSIRLHLNSLKLSRYEDILAFLGRGGHLTCIFRIELEPLFHLPKILTNNSLPLCAYLFLGFIDYCSEICSNLFLCPDDIRKYANISSYRLPPMNCFIGEYVSAVKGDLRNLFLRAEKQWEYRAEFIRLLKENDNFLNVTTDEEMFYNFSFCTTLEEFTFCVQGIFEICFMTSEVTLFHVRFSIVKLPSDVMQAPIVYNLVPSVPTLPSTSEEMLFEFKFHILDNLTPQSRLDSFLVELRKSMSSVKQKLECLEMENEQTEENEEEQKEENEDPTEGDATDGQKEDAKSE